MFISISPHVGSISHLTCSPPCKNNIFHLAWKNSQNSHEATPIPSIRYLYESPITQFEPSSQMPYYLDFRNYKLSPLWHTTPRAIQCTWDFYDAVCQFLSNVSFRCAFQLFEFHSHIISFCKEKVHVV